MVAYADGTEAKIGDVVRGDGKPARYIVVGFDGPKGILLQIGFVSKPEDSPLFGKTVILRPACIRSIPLGTFEHIGCAEEATIRKDSAPFYEVKLEEQQG